MFHFTPPLDFPQLLEGKIRDVIKENIPQLKKFSLGEREGIPTMSYPLTTIMIEGDQKVPHATGLDRYIYTGYVAIDIRQPDNSTGFPFQDDTHIVTSYTHGRWFIRQVQLFLTLTELQTIKFKERNESVLEVEWAQKQYGLIDRDGGPHNRAILPFTITTQATSTDC
jgi:hypothetical protein